MPKVSIPGATLGAIGSLRDATALSTSLSHVTWYFPCIVSLLYSVTFRNNTIGLAGLNNSSSSVSDMCTYCFAVSKDPAMTAKGFRGRPLRCRKVCTAFSCKASHTK